MQVLSLYSYLPLLGSFVVFSLGLFVWLKKPKDLLVILFFLYDITNAVWLLGTFFLFNSLIPRRFASWYPHLITPCSG